jgi:hypothetical protein
MVNSFIPGDELFQESSSYSYYEMMAARALGNLAGHLRPLANWIRPLKKKKLKL